MSSKQDFTLDRHFNADLHCHSTASDGALSPSTIVLRAIEHGVQMLSITDHDNFDGLQEASDAAEGQIKLISGIEFSSLWNGMNIHIVGLDFDPNLLAESVCLQKQARESRTLVISERLEKQGVKNALEGAKSFATSAVIGRPHFAKYLVAQGHFASEADAFKKWLGSGKIGDVKATWPDIETVVNYIKGAGGHAVLAHPHKYKMTNRKLGLFLEEFTECGGTGMEVSTTGITPDQIQYFASLCRRYELMASRGSDFHTPAATWTELGRVPALPDNVTPIWQAFK